MLKKYLKANDLDCPLPLLKTKLSLSELNSREILELTATDPTSWEDFASYAKIREAISLFMLKKRTGSLFIE